MVQIIPAVLGKTEEQYKADMDKLSQCEAFKNGWVHIDFTDNKFVQNKSIEPETVRKFPTNFRKEAHLMVSHPKECIDKLLDAGFERIIFHIESEDNIDEAIDYIKTKSIKVGLAIKMDTPVEKLGSYKDKIDLVLVMSIVPGFQGQPFIPEALERIKEIKSFSWPVIIGVDGSVNNQNAKDLVNAGVDNLIVGSFLLKGDIDENLERLWEAIYGV